MKRGIRIICIGLIGGLLITGSAWGQAADKISKSKHVQFSKEKDKTEVKITTTKEYNHLKLNISCHLQHGAAKIEILNPKGEVKGNFSLETDQKETDGKETTRSMASGELSKSFLNPMIGVWKIRITPKEMIIGNAQIEYEQAFYGDIAKRLPQDNSTVK